MEDNRRFLEVFMGIVDSFEKMFNRTPGLDWGQIEVESDKILKNLPEVRFYYTGGVVIAGDLCITAIINVDIPNDCLIIALKWSISLNPNPVITIQSFKLIKESCTMPYKYTPIQFHFKTSNKLRKLNLTRALHLNTLSTPSKDKSNLKSSFNNKLSKPSRNLQITLNPNLRITQFDDKSLDYIKNYLELINSL